MAIGNMGPRRIPMKEMAMALPIREGVNHIVNSKLFFFFDFERESSFFFSSRRHLKINNN